MLPSVFMIEIKTTHYACLDCTVKFPTMIVGDRNIPRWLGADTRTKYKLP